VNDSLITDFSTVYVDEYFEVRAHDTPSKYVFNGNARVAKVTGMLSANARVQRLRFSPGWNLGSLGITASNALSQLSVPTLESLYRWEAAASNFVPVGASETLLAGSVLWAKFTAGSVLSVLGADSELTNLPLRAGGDFVAPAGLEAWDLTGALPSDASLWKRAFASNAWEIQLGLPLNTNDGQQGFVAPGEAVFVRATEPLWLAGPPPALRIRYYHQDHLGSSAAICDASGDTLEENAFFPFGTLRVSNHPRAAAEPYKFSQIERDAESGFDAFPARAYTSLLGHFIQPDPLYENLSTADAGPAGEALLRPQKLNPYAYVRNNPLRYVDPSGLDDTQQTGEPQPGSETPPPTSRGNTAQPTTTAPAPNNQPQPAPQPNPIAAKSPQPPPGLVVTVPQPKYNAWQHAESSWQTATGQPGTAPKAGSAGDVTSAVGKVELNGQSIQDRALGALTQPMKKDWEKATPGEKALIIGAGVVMVGAAAPALQKKEAVSALQQIIPKVEVPIPLGKGLELKVSVSTSKPEGGITLGGRF
jgi:RHS repeat-associated protein